MKYFETLSIFFLFVAFAWFAFTWALVGSVPTLSKFL